MLVERLLERMKLTVFRHSLDGYDLPTLSLDGKHGTRLDRVSIQMHGASTAIAGVTPHVRARELGHCSDEVRLCIACLHSFTPCAALGYRQRPTEELLRHLLAIFCRTPNIRDKLGGFGDLPSSLPKELFTRLFPFE